MDTLVGSPTKHRTDWQGPERRSRMGNGGKKEKGLMKKHVWVTHGHGQQCGNWLWECRAGWAEEGKGGKIGTTVIE